MEKYGESTKVPIALSGNILKEEKVEKVSFIFLKKWSCFYYGLGKQSKTN